MRRFRKLASIAMSLTLAASMSASMACTVVAAGKDATVDGSTIISHTCDSWYDHRIQVIPGGKHAAGEAVEIFRDPCMETMETAVKVGEIPQVEETNTYFNIAYPFMNDKGITVAEHTWVGREDVYNGDGLFVIANIDMLGLQRADNARDMVKTMGALAEQYGYCDWGECLVVADPQEVWVFEICGPGATWTKDSGEDGAHWAARRLADDEIYGGSNRSRLGVIDFNDPDNYMWSTNITKLPEAMGWWKEGEEFNFTEIFDDPGTAFGCSRREWRIFDLLAHSQNLPSNHDGEMPYPFSVKPDEKICIQDVMKVYEDHYEGTQYDMTQGLAAGPFHCPVMFRVKGDQKPEDVKQYNWERSIGIYRCSYSFVSQCRDWMPAEVGTCLWFGEDDPTTTCRVPVYAGTNTVPTEWSTGDRYNFDPSCSWWAFNFLNNWACLRWDMMYADIDAKRDEIEGKFFENQEAFEAEAVEKLNADNAAGREFITDYVCENMDLVNNEWWKFAFEMVGKYADGQVVTADGYTSPGYPTEYLEAVGFGQTALADAKLNAGETVEPEAPEATPAPEATEAPAPEATKAPETAAPETAAPETAAPEAPAEESGSNTGLIIGIVVVVLVVIAVVVMNKKKKDNK